MRSTKSDVSVEINLLQAISNRSAMSYYRACASCCRRGEKMEDGAFPPTMLCASSEGMTYVMATPVTAYKSTKILNFKESHITLSPIKLYIIVNIS